MPMIFRQLFDQTSSTYTYLIGDAVTRQSVIIDPVLEKLEQYLQFIKELDLELIASIDTHTHADHITASGKLREALQCEIVMGEQSKVHGITQHIADGETLCFGELMLTAIYTPGHTDDCYSFAMPDRVFTGDTLFIRGTGRTDFQSGDPYQAYDSIINKLFRLPKNTLVYPGHDYCGRTVSSIDEEQRFNPRLQVKSAAEYAKIMAKLNLAKPKLIDIAVPANQRCGI